VFYLLFIIPQGAILSILKSQKPLKKSEIGYSVAVVVDHNYIELQQVSNTMRYTSGVQTKTIRITETVYTVIMLYAKEHHISLMNALTRLVVKGACSPTDLKEVIESDGTNEKKNDK